MVSSLATTPPFWWVVIPDMDRHGMLREIGKHQSVRERMHNKEATALTSENGLHVKC
jgi:hypothetical protein